MSSVSHAEQLDFERHPNATGCGAVAFRFLSFIFGAALLIAGIGLWLVPGSSWSAEVMLIKLGLTGLFTLGGISFLQAARCRRGL